MGLLIFVVFLGVPLVEIALFVVVGGEIGVVATMAMVVVTAVAGAALVRHQGLQTLAKARTEFEKDRLPAGTLGEGLAILAAGALLLTPGFFTDTVGFALLVPPLRRVIVAAMAAWLAPRIVAVDLRSGSAPGGRGTVIEGEAVEVDEPERPGAPSDGSPWRKS